MLEASSQRIAHSRTRGFGSTIAGIAPPCPAPITARTPSACTLAIGDIDDLTTCSSSVDACFTISGFPCTWSRSHKSRDAVSRCHPFGCSSTSINCVKVDFSSCGFAGRLKSTGTIRYTLPRSRPLVRSRCCLISSGKLLGCSITSRYRSAMYSVPSGAFAN